MITGLKAAYCVVSFADTVLANNATWAAFTDDKKEDSLQYGRLYIDANYSFNSFVTGSTPEYLQLANALLGPEENIFSAEENAKPA